MNPKENSFEALLSEWEKTNAIIDKDSFLEKQDVKIFKEKEASDLKIDLHGLTKIEALNKLKKFVEINQKSDIIKIIIIHGVGRHSKEKRVLKESVREWLSDNKLIRNFRPAQVGEGSTGATVAYLKAR